MKAIVVREFGGPEVMKIEEAPPPSIGPGQILIRVRAVGVNPVDTYIRSGLYARKPNLPYTPHADIAGTVEAVGAGVTTVKAADRVYAYMVDGGGAELARAEEWQVQRLPDRATFQQGAAMGVPYGTAWRALFLKARARPGETLLVHGASGGVGTAAVQIARAHGMRVIGTAGTDDGLQLVREQGAHEVLNHRDPDYLTKVPGLTGGRGANVILEMLANVNLDRDLDVLAPFGRILVIGNRGRVEIDPRKMMGKDGAVLGIEGTYNWIDKSVVGINALSGSLGPALPNALVYSAVGSTDAHIIDYGTIRLKGGWVANSMFMPYATFGVAVGRMDLNRAVAITPIVSASTPPGTFVPAPFTVTQAIANQFGYGYAAGLGVDMCLMANLFARLEYEYVQFPDFQGINVHMHNVRAGAAFKF